MHVLIYPFMSTANEMHANISAAVEMHEFFPPLDDVIVSKQANLQTSNCILFAHISFGTLMKAK